MPFGKDKEDKKDAGSGYKKIRLGAAKDILDAETPQALDSALYEYIRACIDEESE